MAPQPTQPQEPKTTQEELVSRLGALLFLGFAAAFFWFCALPYLRGGAPFGDDNSSHTAWMIHIATLLRAGHTNFYFDQQNLGVPMFLAYQPLPGLVMGTLHALTSSWLAPWALMKASIVLLWSLMPSAWYVGARWMGLSRFGALALGLSVWLVRDPVNYGLTLRSVAFKGLYSQLFGMFFLPLALGALFRYLIQRQGSFVRPTLYFTLTFLSHGFFGLYVGIASALMLVLTPAHWRQRLSRTLLVYTGTILLMAFWMVPLLQHMGEVGGLPWKPLMHNGWPWKESLHSLAFGKVFDTGRWPWMTVLVAIGLCFGVRRWRQPLERWVLLLFGLTLLLWQGPNQWGSLYQKLPLHRELNVMRYIAGLHTCGLLLVAITLANLAKQLRPKLTKHKFLRSFLGAISMFVLGTAAYQQTGEWRRVLRTFRHQNSPFERVAHTLSQEHTGRYVAHRRLGTTSHFHRDLLAALAKRPHLQSYGMTFHATLGTYFVEYFDFSDTACKLYNVSTLVSRGRPTFSLPTHFVMDRHIGRYRLYQHRDRERFGYFAFVRSPMLLSGHLKTLRPVLKENLLPLYKVATLPRIRPLHRRSPDAIKLHFGDTHIQGSHAVRAWLRRYLERKRPHQALVSTVLKESSSFNRYSAKVKAHKGEVLVLKVNAFPYWTASYIQKSKRYPLEIRRIAPNYMAVKPPEGLSTIHFVYRNPLLQKGAFVFSCFILVSMGVMSLSKKGS